MYKCCNQIYTNSWYHEYDISLLVNDRYAVHLSFETSKRTTFAEQSVFVATYLIGRYGKWDKVQIHVSRGGSTRGDVNVSTRLTRIISTSASGQEGYQRSVWPVSPVSAVPCHGPRWPTLAEIASAPGLSYGLLCCCQNTVRVPVGILVRANVWRSLRLSYHFINRLWRHRQVCIRLDWLLLFVPACTRCALSTCKGKRYHLYIAILSIAINENHHIL